MTPRTSLLAVPLALGFALAACDGRDREAQVTALSEELSATRAELDAAMNENRRLERELERLRAQTESAGDAAGGVAIEGGEATTGGGGMAPAVGEAVRGELQAITEKLNTALADLEGIDAGNAELDEVRESLREVAESAKTVRTVISGSGARRNPTPDATGGALPPEVMEDLLEGQQPRQP